jgi:hypothetical protein
MYGCDPVLNALPVCEKNHPKNHGVVPAVGKLIEVVQLDRGGEIMGPLSMQDMKGGFFLIASFLLLAMICAIAALGTVMRPQRWCERETRLHV